MTADARPPRLVAWVAPPFDGPRTGGTRYNRELALGLVRRGVDVERLDVARARVVAASGIDATLWVDSLFLEDFPALVSLARSPARVGLVVHYLPALVIHGRPVSRAELSPVEARALGVAGRILATSPWLARTLAELGVSPRRIRVVEPGVDGEGAEGITEPRPARPAGCAFEAVVVANLLPGKGILPLLERLAAEASLDVRVNIVGSCELDPGYAAACRAAVERSEHLRARVRFSGSLSYAGVVQALMASDVCVSSSRMETYGMALAAARAVGVPVVARAGGAVAEYVRSEAGGAPCDADAGVVAELARLSRDRAELGRRERLAGALRLRRTWDDAAADFLSGEEACS